MILHTNLTIPECIERLTQPFLSDPDTADTANIIKRPSLPQTGEYYTQALEIYGWAIFITSRGDDFEIEMRGCSSPGICGKVKDSAVSHSVSCTMKENSSGGTDIECKKIGSFYTPIIIGVVAFSLLFLSFCSPELLHMSYDMETLMLWLIALFLVVSIVSAYKAVRIFRSEKLIDFAAELLDAREI